MTRRILPAWSRTRQTQPAVKDFAAEEIVAALPVADQPVVEGLIAQCRRRGTALYLIGGPVRDLLLERPLHDVDLIVEPVGRHGSATGEVLARAVARGELQVAVHERFGTVSITGGIEGYGFSYS